MKILLVDDHILFREGLASLIDAQAELTVVGFAGSVKDALSQTENLQPELVLMDFNLPDGDGLHYVSQISDQYSETKVVFLVTNDDEILRLETIDDHTVGYLRKNTPVNDLLSYIHNLRGETSFSHSTIDG
ncbi:MAG: response regulator transcription factor [Ardenticatenaceae bacterium]|nr:response regulator transcription factor [Ardenticatenaceae bacterium]MCB9443887.1 response regulator transcription factor [Ardenticatenaceae bacterium]